MRTVIDQLSVRWDVRNVAQTHRRTFVSNIDGSVQYYGVVPPLRRFGRPPATSQPVPVTARCGCRRGRPGSGLRREAQRLCRHAHNRRSFGFDWEDWGRWDALEVLQQASARFQTDPQRTYLTGHSMGGHGTWHIGTLFPDRFAAIGPSAGWISFSTYAGGQPAPTEDPVSQMLRRSLLAGDTFSRVQNLAYQGVYILHGERDDNVPVEQARTMRERLAKFHPDFVYREQPGAGHWWGNACCDWPAMFAFFADHELPRPEQVERVNFATPGPAVSPRCFWATVAAQVTARTAQSRQSAIQSRHADDFRDARTTCIGWRCSWVRCGATQKDAADFTSLTVDLDGVKLADIPLGQQEVAVARAERSGVARHRRARCD